MNTPAGGKFVAWAGFLFGSVVSIAANVLHAWIPKPPEGAPDNWVPPAEWEPSVAAQLGAAVWPIALLLSVEAISRVRWRSGALWVLIRFGGLGVVGLGSFAISYGHLHEVLVSWNYSELGAAVGPIVIDGLMVVSGFALLSEAGQPATEQKAEKPAPKKQWVVADVEKRSNGQVVEHVVEDPKSDDDPEPEPPKPNVRSIRGQTSRAARVKELMKQEGVSKATAYRRVREEDERGCA